MTYQYNDLRIDVHCQLAAAETENNDSNNDNDQTTTTTTTTTTTASDLANNEHRKEAVQALRDACIYERDEDYDFQQQKWLVVLFSIVGPKYETLMRTEIQALSDEELWRALLTQSRHSSSNRASGPTFDVELKKCHGCHATEQTRGEFEECSKCFEVSYCSYECQKQHWKVHKQKCSKPKWSPRSALSFPWRS